MITVLGSHRPCCDGLTRRETLRVGALSLLGGLFNLPSLLALERSGSARAGRARNVILLYLQGGPATQDMFDLKPDAPTGIRSEFRPIATSAAGIAVCEHLPRTARWMHKTAVVRTAHHAGGCHNNLPMYTGYDVPPPDIDSSRPTDPPSMGSVCTYLLRDTPSLLPPYIYLPCPLGWGEFKKKPGPHGGFLGQRYNPFSMECTASIDNPGDTITDMQVVRGEPTLPGMHLRDGITVDALATRRGLLAEIEGQLRSMDDLPTVRNYTERQRIAFDLLTSAPVGLRPGPGAGPRPRPLRAHVVRVQHAAGSPSGGAGRPLCERELGQFSRALPGDQSGLGHPRAQLPHPSGKSPAQLRPDLFRADGRPRPAGAA
jgi:Protein of unknown function (DUF1501)